MFEIWHRAGIQERVFTIEDANARLAHYKNLYKGLYWLEYNLPIK